MNKKVVGNITIVSSLAGVHFLIDSRDDTTEEDWDAAITAAWRQGYQLPDEPESREVGIWEIWDLVPVPAVA